MVTVVTNLLQQEKLFCILQFFQPPSTALFIGFPAERTVKSDWLKRHNHRL